MKINGERDRYGSVGSRILPGGEFWGSPPVWPTWGLQRGKIEIGFVQRSLSAVVSVPTVRVTVVPKFILTPVVESLFPLGLIPTSAAEVHGFPYASIVANRVPKFQKVSNSVVKLLFNNELARLIESVGTVWGRRGRVVVTWFLYVNILS